MWTRWGRVGVPGQHAKADFDSFEAARKEFGSKFNAKTGNAWANDIRSTFTFKKGKYMLIEKEGGGDEPPAKKQKTVAESGRLRPSGAAN